MENLDYYTSWKLDSTKSIRFKDYEALEFFTTFSYDTLNGRGKTIVIDLFDKVLNLSVTVSEEDFENNAEVDRIFESVIIE